MHRVQEYSAFTWDPVHARWIHERGPEITTPPVPPDVHAIQTYFFDPDEKEWIATVLAPHGRELAAQWHGAYKVPDQVAPPAPKVKKRAPLPLVGLVLGAFVLSGGAFVVVGQRAAAPSPAISASPIAGTDTPVAPTPSGTATASPDATASPTNGATPAPGQTAARTQPPVVRTPARTAPPVSGTSVTLADGSVVTYAGPTRVNIGEPAMMTFMVRTGGASGSGTLLVSYGNASTGGAKTSSGTLDPFGRLTLTMSGAALPGNYPIIVNYKGYQSQIAILRVG